MHKNSLPHRAYWLHDFLVSGHPRSLARKSRQVNPCLHGQDRQLGRMRVLPVMHCHELSAQFAMVLHGCAEGIPDSGKHIPSCWAMACTGRLPCLLPAPGDAGGLATRIIGKRCTAGATSDYDMVIFQELQAISPALLPHSPSAPGTMLTLVGCPRRRYVEPPPLRSFAMPFAIRSTAL